PPQGRKLCYERSKVFNFNTTADLEAFTIESGHQAFNVANGMLTVSMRNQGGYGNPTMSFPQFLSQGGIWEGRIKAAPTSGVVTAFVLYGDGVIGATDEMDYEWVGKDTSNVQSMFFPKGQRIDGVTVEQHVYPNPAADLAASYHIYGLEYNSDYVSWWIDGTVSRTLTKANPNQFPGALGKFRFGLWDGTNTSGWAGAVDWSKAPFDASIDWLRYTPYC
ncbi:hypothetical protein EV182_003795, partial [Spiromyces aspiralis]